MEFLKAKPKSITTLKSLSTTQNPKWIKLTLNLSANKQENFRVFPTL